MERLLERDAALSRLAVALERVRTTASGEAITVSGEAGVGKTSLMRAFASELSGTEVLWGACDGLRTPRPLGPLLDIAAAAGGELASVAQQSAASRGDIFSAAVAQVAAAYKPVVLVIEDAHWADDATLDFLTFLGRRIERLRAALVLTYRNDEVGASHPLRVVLGDIASSTRERILLTPLTIESVALLSEGRGFDPAQLHAVTGGNPFYVTESLAAGTDELPGSVRDAVLARVARLSDAGRRALEGLAVIPGGAELELIESIAGPDARALDECVERGMVTVADGRALLRHELARLAVVDAIAPARRRGLHRRALRALTQRTSETIDAARLTHHAVEAGDADAVRSYAPLAAEQAVAAGAHREAVAHLQEALRAGDRATPAARGALLDRLGEELSLTGQFSEAVETLSAARALWREIGDERREGRTLLKLAGPFTSSARTPEAVASVQAALAILEPLGTGSELAEAYVSLASYRMLARELDEAIEWSYRAEHMAEQLGESSAIAYARIQGGVAELMAESDRGLPRIQSGIDLAREIGLDHRVVLGLSQIGSGAGEIRRYDVAVPALHECKRVCQERELLASELYVTAWLARCEFELGRWDSAAAFATEVLANLRATGIARFVAIGVLGRLRARRGDPEIWAALDEALDLARQTGHLQRLWPIAAARAEAAWLEGRLADETPLVAEVFDLAADLAYPWAVGELGFWLWRAGMRADVPSLSPEPYRLHAMGRLNEAAERWRALGCPYEEADCLADSEDTTALRSALAIFGDLGARPMVSSITERLRAAGERVARGPNRAARANPSGMTDREVEVLALLAAGLSNKEVAARLGISAKTAGHHVSHILSKLGAANRAEAAVAAERMGIATTER